MASLIAPILTGISGIAGLLGGGTQQKSATSQTSSGTQNTTGSSASSTTPNLSPIQQSLINQFTAGAENLANQGTNLQPYEASGLQQIGQTGNTNQQNISNTLAAKGLQYSPAAGNAYTQNTINTGNQQSQFLNQIPLLQRQIQQQNIQGLESAFQVQPTATSSTGTQNQTQTSNQTTTGNGALSGNPAAGLFSGLGAGLAATYPSLASSFGGGVSNGSGIGGTIPIPTGTPFPASTISLPQDPSEDFE